MVRFEGIRHLHLKVADVERAARFYEQGFGMRRFGPSKHGGKMVPLVSPGMKDQLTLSEGAGELGPSTAQVGDQGGIDHFGFILSPGSNLEEAVERLTRLGATFLQRQDIAASVPSVFLRDPDGYVFQVTRFPRLARLYVFLLPVLRWLRPAA